MGEKIAPVFKSYIIKYSESHIFKKKIYGITYYATGQVILAGQRNINEEWNFPFVFYNNYVC